MNERIELYLKLEQEIRDKYSATVIIKITGNHTEVSISNVGRNTTKQAQEYTTGVKESLHETFIRAAERFIAKVNEKA